MNTAKQALDKLFKLSDEEKDPGIEEVYILIINQRNLCMMQLFLNQMILLI